MTEFSFKEEKNILFPKVANFKPILNKNGTPLSGDELIRKFGKIITAYETKTGMPIPIQDQKFVDWLKYCCSELDAGKTSDEIFKSTLVVQGL